MTHGSLFSGIGGFDLAAEWAGWENMFHCEWNEFGKRVLNYYWPKAISYGDITKTDFTIWRGRIDVLSGGFPCQPGKTSQLNPRFVAEMMGFPANWTELPFLNGEQNQSKPTETP